MNIWNLCFKILMFGLIAISAAIPASGQVSLSRSASGHRAN